MAGYLGLGDVPAARDRIVGVGRMLVGRRRAGRRGAGRRRAGRRGARRVGGLGMGMEFTTST
jgi:hypothetical protein